MRICILSFTLILVVGSAMAGPNQSELTGYRCIVPDWSKTSGGTNPALSPDGNTLAYLSIDKVWIVSNLNAYRPASRETAGPVAPPQPWQLDVRIPETPDRSALIVENEEGFRNTDWSRDGKRLAFVFEGRLLVADNLDPIKKTADIRMLAEPTVGPDNALGVKSPRWSPDGSKIAFRRLSTAGGPAACVSVLDVASGTEKTVARDAIRRREIWDQPWSPDGKQLVYGSVTIRDERNAVLGGISIAAVDKEAPRKIVDQGMAYFPSWSPTGEMIAYSGPYNTVGISGMLPGLHITDQSGKERKPVSKPEPPKQQVSQAMAEMQERLIKMLKERYPEVYTQAQLERFTADDVTDNEVMGIIMLAEAVTEAKSIGGEFQRRIKDAMKAFNAKGKSFVLKKDLPAPAASEAINALPEEQNRRIQERMGEAVNEITNPLSRLKSKVDEFPAWSPDGKRIAFVRWNMLNEMEGGSGRQVIVADISSGKTRVVFEEGNISGLLWSGDGKSLVVEASRNLAFAVSVTKSVTPWPTFITVPSYPEIWILDLKSQN